MGLMRRISVETNTLQPQREFNESTSELIDALFKRFRFPRLTHMLIKEYYRVSVKPGVAHTLRKCRATVWREVVRAAPLKKRKTAQSMQSRTGRRRGHEELMVQYYDVGWQEQQQICNPAPRKPAIRKLISSTCVDNELKTPFYDDLK